MSGIHDRQLSADFLIVDRGRVQHLSEPQA